MKLTRRLKLVCLLLVGLLAQCSAIFGQSTDLVTSYWETPETPVLSTTPGSIVTLIRAYKFSNNGKVVATYSKVVKYQPPPAQVCESVPVSEIGFDGIARTTMRMECRTPFFIPEPPVIYDIQGTYQVTDNKITMSFPGVYSVRATISKNAMSGYLTEGGSSEFWTVSRKTTAKTADSGTATPSKEPDATQPPIARQPSRVLSKQIIEKYNPTPLTTNRLWGKFQYPFATTNHYYTFVAGPGEVTLTLVVESQQPPLSVPSTGYLALFDTDELLLGTSSMPGLNGSTQGFAKINIPSEQPVLLRISGSGLGKYRVELDGAIQIGIAVGSSPMLRRMDELLPSSLLLSVKNLVRGNRLVAQKRFREGIEYYRKVIQLDTQPYNIEASIFSGDARLELQDYRGAIDDYSRARRLCASARIDYELKRATIKDPYAALAPEARSEMRAQSILDKGPEFATWDKLELNKKIADTWFAPALSRRAVARSRVGDTAGACEDFRAACTLKDSAACDSVKKTCN
jgi:hypothetical protein